MKKIQSTLILLIFLSSFLLTGCEVYLWEKGEATWQDKAIEQYDPELCLKASNPTVCLQSYVRINKDETGCYFIEDKKIHDECIRSIANA